MVLAAHSDASYLSETKARIIAGGHLFMSNEASTLSNNGVVINISQNIKDIMSSTVAADLGSLFINFQEAIQHAKRRK